MTEVFDLSRFDEYREDNRREVKKASTQGSPRSIGKLLDPCRLSWIAWYRDQKRSRQADFGKSRLCENWHETDAPRR